MRRVVPRDDEGWEVELHQRLGHRTGNGVTVEEHSPHVGDELGVLAGVPLGIHLREHLVPADHGRPWAHARVLRKALVIGTRERDHAREVMPLDVGDVLREAVVLVDADRPARRRVQDHPVDALRMGDCECGHAGAADAAAEQMCALDVEVVEETGSLSRVVGPM